MDGTHSSHMEEAKNMSSGSKRGGWTSFPFIIGLSFCAASNVPYSLTLSLSTNILKTCSHNWMFFFFVLLNSGTVAGLTLASSGIWANLIVYLIEEFNIKSITAAQIANVVNGSTSLFPFVGAIIADSFFGSFPVALVSSCVALLVSHNYICNHFVLSCLA